MLMGRDWVNNSQQFNKFHDVLTQFSKLKLKVSKSDSQ